MNVKKLIKALQIPSTDKRVEKHTRKKINDSIKLKTIKYINVYGCADYGELTERLDELEKEWDTERVLELTDGALLTAISALGFTFRRPGLFFLTGLVGVFLANHALEGWCPAQEVIRALKIRTPSEIYIEKTAVKYLRGDFSEYSDDPVKIFEIARADGH